MNIIEILQQSKEVKTTKNGVRAAEPKSPRSEFRDLKKDLPEAVKTDISEFQKQFPQLKEHTIYNIMKRHEFKRNLVETELKFKAVMQDSQPVSKREHRPKKPQQEQTDKTQQKPKEEQLPPKQRQQYPDKRFNNETLKDKPSNEQFRDNREWRDRNDAKGYRPRPPYEYQHRPQHQNYQQRPFNRDQQDYQQRPYFGNKYQNRRPRGQWQGNEQHEEYVVRQANEDQQKTVKKQLEQEQDKELSNINEESDDLSNHKANVDKSREKRSAKHSAHQNDTNQQKSSEQTDKLSVPSANRQSAERKLSGHEVHQNAQTNGQPQNAHIVNQFHTESKSATHHPKTPEPKVYYENGLMSNGINLLAKTVKKWEVYWFKQFIEAVHHLDVRPARTESRGQTDKRGNFLESKKRKPAIKNNFETEENDESTNERAKKMNYYIGQKKFESEEERLKGERERIMESKINNQASQFDWLTQKVKDLEEEVAALRAANQELIVHQKAMIGSHDDSVYCFVPFHFVKDSYPFNSIKMSDVKSGNVYMIKKDN